MMNRGRSRDSLDNGDHDVILSSSNSSSPTDFTSDDEAASNLYLMAGQPLGSTRPKLMNNKGMSKLIGELLQTSRQHLNRPIRTGNTCVSSQHSYSNNIRKSGMGEPVSNLQSMSANDRVNLMYNSAVQRRNDRFITRNESTQNEHYADPHGWGDDVEDDKLERKLNAVDGILNSAAVRQLHRDLVTQDNHTRIKNMADVYLSHELDPSQRDSTTARSYHHIEHRPIFERGGSTTTIRLCSRLVECRNLIDAIELVESNRDVISNLTSIITLEAPAYRNYDFSNYQIDYSVKESFNPNFWLDREPIVTTADGNCQYHAISLSLTGSEAFTPEVRLAAAVAVVDNDAWFDSVLKLIDGGSVLDLVRTIARNYSWGDETTLKAIAIAIKKRIFLYTCNVGKKDFEMVKSLTKEELLDAFRNKKFRGGTGIHAYADPLTPVPASEYIMLFHKSEHFIAVLPTNSQPTMFEPYNPIVPLFN